MARQGKLLPIRSSAMGSRIFVTVMVLCSMSLVVDVTEAQSKRSVPAPDVPNQCNSVEKCCMPTPYTGTPGIRQFEFDPTSPLRTRRPAHLLTKFEIDRLERGYALLRALPDSDPRSMLNQMKLHCLYCDNGLYYPGEEYPLEIHNGWYFLPWHRMFIYWHERILAKVLNDSTFALPFWAWDNQEDTNPPANVIPAQYTNTSSSLYDPLRNNCSSVNPYIDFDNRSGACTNKTADYMRVQNNRLMYSQIVVGAPTTSLFYGMPYYFGDWGGAGPGTIEDSPHAPVHAWVGNPFAQPPQLFLDDLGNFGHAARDPVFYAHHSNVDRMWWLWTQIPGGARSIPQSSIFNNSQFTFYDEDANLVKMNVSQSLDHNLLRYKYENLPTPWVTNGVVAGNENTIAHCNPLSESAVNSLVNATQEFDSDLVLTETTTLTFKVSRPARSSVGTEVLELSGLIVPNIHALAQWKAYVFYPTAVMSTNAWCPEYAGTFNYFPHLGQATIIPKRSWLVAIGPKLSQIGKDFVTSVVITLVQTSPPPGQNLTFTKAEIYYDLSPTVTHDD